MECRTAGVVAKRAATGRIRWGGVGGETEASTTRQEKCEVLTMARLAHSWLMTTTETTETAVAKQCDVTPNDHIV